MKIEKSPFTPSRETVVAMTSGFAVVSFLSSLFGLLPYQTNLAEIVSAIFIALVVAAGGLATGLAWASHHPA
jgi:hypothetical protein